MSQLNRPNLLTDIINNIYTNVVNYITGNNLQNRLKNIADSAPNILSDKDQANGYVGLDSNANMFSSYYNQNISRADLQSLLAANLAVGFKFYQINDAVGSTRTLLVMAESNINLYPWAVDVTTGEIGTYDIAGDDFFSVLPIVPSGVATVVDITKTAFIGLFAGFDVDPKACYRITDAAQGVVRVFGVTTGTSTAAAFLEGSWDGSILTDGAWGNYNVQTDVFAEKSGLVITISAVDFAALVTNNLLTIGQQYIVLEAYTSNVWGSIGSPCKFSFLVLADSPNTISSSYCYCYSNLDSRLFQCYTVSDFSEFKIYDPISIQYALTKDIIDAGSYSSEINNNSDIYLLLVTQSLYLKSFFENVIQYKNVVSISDSPFGVGTVGNYDVTTDIFTPNSGTWTPILNPDGTVITTSPDIELALYSVVGNVANVSISMKNIDADFSADGGTNVGNITIDTLPIPTGSPLLIGSAEFKLNSSIAMPSLPLYLSLSTDGTIVLYCDDLTFSFTGGGITVNFQYPIN